MRKNILFINRTSSQPFSLAALKKDGFQVDMVHDSVMASQRLDKQDYDVIILQEVPSAGSWQFCRDIRRISTIPLIVISHNASTEACISTINAGADFFLRKPFGPQELLARIRALIYRSTLRTRHQLRQPVPTS